MQDTRFRKDLMRLCEENPELRKKLAAEFVRLKTPVRKKAHDEYMVMRSLMKLADRVPDITRMIGSNPDELEDWQEFKINQAAEAMDSVFDSLYFRRQLEKEHK
jgi:hypothetical protein